MTVRIAGACLRDISYVAANLRPDDVAEVDALFDSWSPTLVAALSLRDYAYIATLNGNPEAAFGAGRVGTHSGLWTAWSFGGARMWRCVPRITAFVREVMFPALYEAGAWRVEARALASNAMARRWLLKLGATERCELRNYGKRGESFVLFDWVRNDWASPLSSQPAKDDASAAAEMGEPGLGGSAVAGDDLLSHIGGGRLHAA